MLSISLGLIKFNGFLDPPTPPLSTGTPSITNKGSLVNDNEPIPLILMLCPSPGEPPLEEIFTPATFPLINCCGDNTGPSLKSLDVIKSTVPVASFFLTAPYPITTTSFNSCKSSSNLIVTED